MPDFSDTINKHANRVGIDPKWLTKIMHIESGGDSSNRTGSYKGLFQLSDKEFKAHGGGNNIYDPEQNTMAAANKLAGEKLRFEQRTGRTASLKDLYMIHQQGEGGAAAHAANPDQPAWKSMASTAEGRRKGEAWAKKAIWGNVPDNLKAKYGSVDNITSRQFTDEVWGSKLEGTSGDISARASTSGGPGKTKWHRSGEDKPASSETDADKSKRSLMNQEWEDIKVPEFHVSDMVPRISLAKSPV